MYVSKYISLPISLDFPFVVVVARDCELDVSFPSVCTLPVRRRPHTRRRVLVLADATPPPSSLFLGFLPFFLDLAEPYCFLLLGMILEVSYLVGRVLFKEDSL